MGILHEGHSKRKINKDPNNTKWTRDTNTFGQKILRAQGWQPGQYLGAQDAPHSELHTSANASYIRVVLKDDMKGLGFSKSKENEVTGLDVFQDLLSRLNGKSDAAVEEDRQVRLAVKTHHYVERRYGPMRFVRGGLLVGDEMKEESNEEESEESTNESEDKAEPMDVDSAAPKESKKEKKSKKRKAGDDDDVDTADRDSESKSKKRRKEEKKLKKEKSRSKKDSDKAVGDGSEDEATSEKEKSKKRKSKSKDKSKSPEDSENDQVKELKKSKKDKKDKKEKKDKKKRRKEEAEASDSATQGSTPAASATGTGTSTPTGTGTGTSTPRGSRNFVRSRFIAQKKQALLDTKALNQIFMVKA